MPFKIMKIALVSVLGFLFCVSSFGSNFHSSSYWQTDSPASCSLGEKIIIY